MAVSLKNLPGSQVYSPRGTETSDSVHVNPAVDLSLIMAQGELSLGLLRLRTPAALLYPEDEGIGVTVAWDAHRSIDSFWANSRQSLPRELGASRLLQIFWRMDSGILKA